MNNEKGRKIIEGIKDLVNKIFEQNLFTECAALSYYFALSLVPILILTLSILSLLGPQSSTEFSNQITDLMGYQAATVINTVIESTKKSSDVRTFSEIIGIIMLIISASSVFSKLKDVLSKIFDHPIQNKSLSTLQEIWSVIRDRLLAISLMVVLILTLLVAIISSVVISFLFSQEKIGSLAQIINQIFSFSIYTLLFGIIFYYSPKKRLIFCFSHYFHTNYKNQTITRGEYDKENKNHYRNNNRLGSI
jgi:membrane protein